MLDNLKAKLTEWVIETAIKNITPEAVGNVLKKVLELLEDKSAETENVLDDWILEGLEAIFTNEEKIQLITDFIKEKIAGNVCKNSDKHDYALLALALNDLRECQGGFITSILAKLLEVVILVIIENMTEEKE